MQLGAISLLYSRLGRSRLLYLLGLAVFGAVVSCDEHLGCFAESLFDVVCSLGTGLNILNFMVLLGEGRHLLKGHFPIPFQVTLVTHQQNLGVCRTVVSDLSVPVFSSIFERLGIGDIEYHHDGMCPTVIRAGDGPKAFVASSVPNLQFDGAALKGEGLEAEVHADGG